MKNLFERIHQKENIIQTVSLAALAELKTHENWGLQPEDFLAPRKPIAEDALKTPFTYSHGALAEEPASSETLEATIASFWVNYPRNHSQLSHSARRQMFMTLAADTGFFTYVKPQVAVQPEVLIFGAGPKVD